MAIALFPALYLGLPIGALLAIRRRLGAPGLFLLMLTIIASDTAQYYTGRAFGRRPLAATISPKKTIEGAVGGVVIGTAVLAGAGAWWLTGPGRSRSSGPGRARRDGGCRRHRRRSLRIDVEA